MSASRPKAAAGEIVLGVTFVAAGAFWIHQSLKLQLWDGFAPAAGFLPLIYGVLLFALAGAALVLEARSAVAPEDALGPVGRPLLVIAVLAVAIAGIEPAGFAASIFFACFFLYKIVEKLPLAPSLLASGGTALVLTLVFRTWLSVPLPKGPWGF